MRRDKSEITTCQPESGANREPGRPPALKGVGLTKFFGGVAANQSVDIDIYPSEIHVLLGENGAGKSTLMKMLYGVYRPDEGECVVDGYARYFRSPAQAMEAGIGMVFQDFRLIPALGVMENILLAMPGLKQRLDFRRAREQIERICEKYQITIDLKAPVWRLDMGQRQRVEIAKVLLSGARILIFDEPTSILSPAEVDTFLETIERLREEKHAVLLVTHKLREVRRCADRVTILRGGRVVFQGCDLSHREDDAFFVEKMIGGRVPALHEKVPSKNGARRVLTVSNLCVRDDRGRNILSDVNFEVRAGQIQGIAGISGNGQKELAETITGLRSPGAGTVEVLGRRMNGASPGAFFRAGVSCIPDDPVNDVLVPGFNVLEHMVLAGLPMRKSGLSIDWRHLRKDFDSLAETQILQAPGPGRIAETLSGGNIQRMMLCKALANNPALLVALYPSRGLDVATMRKIQQLLLDKGRSGMAIVLFSEDLNELFDLSDNILVTARGRVFGPFDPSKVSPQIVAQHMVMEAN